MWKKDVLQLTKQEYRELSRRYRFEPAWYSRYKQVSLEVIKRHPLSLIVLGSGRGIIERMLPEEISCVSVDINEDYVEIARAINASRANRQFQVMSLFDVADHYESGSFDGAIISEVIEHVADDVGALQVAYQMIRPGGYLFLTVPNINRLSNRISRLIGRNVLEDPTHYREYERNGIRQLVEQVGFKVENMQGVYLLLPPENRSRKLIPVDCFLRNAVKWFPGWGRNIMLLCRKP